jgi:prepilin-type N-terminal cleavage/methylation domain-containing protein
MTPGVTPGVTSGVTPGREHGFTLLELLVSLVIFGLLLAALGQGTRFALAARQSQTHQIEVDADLDTVDRTVRHLINTSRIPAAWALPRDYRRWPGTRPGRPM